MDEKMIDYEYEKWSIQLDRFCSLLYFNVVIANISAFVTRLAAAEVCSAPARSPSKTRCRAIVCALEWHCLVPS